MSLNIEIWMIYSRYSTPFYQKKVDASLSFPNHEQSRSIEKGRDTKKKKKKADFTDELPRATTAAFPLSKGV